MTDFEQHLATIQNDFFQKIDYVHKNVISTALELLQHDIEDPQFTAPGMMPDAFMLRANQIGIALFRSGFFSLAERMYRLMAEKTLEYRQTTGNWRHIGAMYANIAGACAAQGNIDQAVIELLRAAEDDVQTYGQIRADSFALTGLLQEYFAKPVRSEALRVVQSVNPSIGSPDLEKLSTNFGEREYALLAYLRLGLVHLQADKAFANEYSKLQLFSSMRNLSALMEIHLKTISGHMHETLFPALQRLYSAKPWWANFQNARISVGAVQNSAVPIDDQLMNACSIAAPDAAVNFWKSLVISYIVRNFTIHNLDPNSTLVTLIPEQVIGHILNVMIHAPVYA